MTRKKKIWIGVLAALLIAQFIRPNRSVPKHDLEGRFDRIETSDRMATDLIKHACYDCHSYERNYPMYAEVAPLSWWIQGHVNGGAMKLNLSNWSSYSEEEKSDHLKEMIEEIEDGSMPLKSYTWLHAEAKWTDEQRNVVLDFLKSIQ